MLRTGAEFYRAGTRKARLEPAQAGGARVLGDSGSGTGSHLGMESASKRGRGSQQKPRGVANQRHGRDDGRKILAITLATRPKFETACDCDLSSMCAFSFVQDGGAWHCSDVRSVMLEMSPSSRE
jgi:hypothetical protein